MTGAKHVRGVVTERRTVAEGLWIVRVQADQHVDFVPGQYVTIGLPVDDKIVERPYSVASAPHEPELEFFLEVVPGGKLTPHLHLVPVGGEVYVRPAAKGRFNFDRQSGHRNHFMVATVTGVAPFVSMVRQLVAVEGRSVPHRITILHSGSVSAEMGYCEELEALAVQQPWFSYVPTISRIWLEPGWRGERGRVEDVARKYLDAMGYVTQSTTAYLCGNPHMIRNMEGILERLGFPTDSVRRENYWPVD